MILNSVQPLSLDPSSTPKQPELPGDDSTLDKVFTTLLWQIQSEQDQQSSTDQAPASASHLPYAFETATAEERQTAMEEIIAALQQWMEAAQENPSVDGQQELEQLNTILAKIQSFFAVSPDEGSQQEIDSLSLLPETGLPDFEDGVVANFAAVTVSEFPDILRVETQQPFASGTRGLSALQQLEKLLQQRLQVLRGQAGSQEAARRAGVAGALTQAVDALNEAGALSVDEDVTVDLPVLRRAKGRLNLDEIKAQVKTQLSNLQAHLQTGRMPLTQVAQTTQQEQVRTDEAVQHLNMSQLKGEETFLGSIVSHVLANVQVLQSREPGNLSLAQPAQGAVGLVQQDMGGAGLSDQAQQADDQGALMNQGSGERGAVVGSGRLLAPITLPLRHPQWGEQLAQRVMILAQNNQNLAQIRLHPAHLGPIQIKLKMDADSSVQVSLHAHHALTREAIEQAVPRLRELFQQQGLTLGDVTVQPDEQGHAQAFADARREQGSHHLGGHAGGEREGTMLDEPLHTGVTRQINGLVDQFV